MLPVLGPQHQHDTAATRTDVMCEPDRLRLHRRTVRRIHYLDAIGPTRNRGSSMPTTTRSCWPTLSGCSTARPRLLPDQCLSAAAASAYGAVATTPNRPGSTIRLGARITGS